MQPNREAIRSSRRPGVAAIVCTVLGLYLGFCIASVLAPALLGAPLSADNPLSIGMALAFGIAWFSVGLALYYVYVSNKEPDPQSRPGRN